ncbi:unnamed protein product [Oreochromis niloticus]|nr:unnamed protein product [Mustela putorius furo]
MLRIKTLDYHFGLFLNASCKINEQQNQEINALRIAVMQHRVALDMILAEKGGLCVLFNNTCCTYIPDNVHSSNMTGALNALRRIQQAQNQDYQDIMEAAALSIQLLTDVLVMMAIQTGHSNLAGAVFARFVPDRLQFFEYESVSVHCEVDNNITEWRVKWKSHKITNASHTSTSPCTIYPTFESHSGEYWCENEKGERSEIVNISVTAGFVILETSTHPVMEGNEVTLNCTNKKTQSEHIADFYKDGVSLGTWNQSSMNIKNVSKSDEGLYKCSIYGAGESPESWLTVIKQSKVALLLLVVGLLLHKRHKVSACFSSVRRSHSREDSTVLQDNNIIDPHQVTYTVVRKQRKKKDEDNSDDPDDVLYATVKSHWKKKEPKLSRADMTPCCREKTVIYSSVKDVQPHT